MILRVNTATAIQIAGHLRVGESDFVDHLMKQVNIENYASKIKKYGCTFEAWSDNQLIGLVAAYLNKENRTGFITNVSVLPGWQSCGIGNQLLRNSIRYLEEAVLNTSPLKCLASEKRLLDCIQNMALSFFCRTGYAHDDAKSRMSGPSQPL